ncbi:unnamed protein product [Symbiodinium pilosum]|uniref:Phosphoribosyltransferase domain-containing protein n=1 Tax=Symbiodinium pilosum TaxID=2952 RepID=A0A812QVA0_SYMPI|nr:unnamed protein product [Symbiodinium pilosum]
MQNAQAGSMLRSATAGQALAADFLRLEAHRDALEGKQLRCLEDMENRKQVNQQRRKAYADILDRRLRAEGTQQSFTKERNLVIRTEATRLCSSAGGDGEAVNQIRASKERFALEVEQMWQDWQQRVATKIREDIDVARRDAEHCKARQQEAMEAMPDKDLPLTAVVGAAAAASAVVGAATGVALFMALKGKEKATSNGPSQPEAANAHVKPAGAASGMMVEDSGVRKRLGEDEYPANAGPTVNLEYFKSKDPNVKFNWKRVVGRKIIFLFDTVDQSRFFEQLSLLQALQGFAVPDGEDKQTKWKTYVNAGAYSWGRASQITVVIPWYRPCQMERTSRWHLDESGKWVNSNPEGAWLDVPNALYMARLLATPGSVPPLPGPNSSMDGMPLNPLWRPPLELLFVELHEEAPVARSVSDLGATIRMERFVPYFLKKYKAKPTYPGKNNVYILFPDHGAYDRYAEAVEQELILDLDHILYIKKTRVGESIGQEQKLFYDQNRTEYEKTSQFNPDKDHILIIDDFTNSGSTLFGAVELVKKYAGGKEINVSIFVSHLVATYDPKVVEGLKDKLHKLGKQCRFYTTNSIPLTTDLLKGDDQATVIDISDFIAELVAEK